MNKRTIAFSTAFVLASLLLLGYGCASKDNKDQDTKYEYTIILEEPQAPPTVEDEEQQNQEATKQENWEYPRQPRIIIKTEKPLTAEEKEKLEQYLKNSLKLKKQQNGIPDGMLPHKDKPAQGYIWPITSGTSDEAKTAMTNKSEDRDLGAGTDAEKLAQPK